MATYISPDNAPTKQRKDRVAYYYHADIGHYHFAPGHPMKARTPIIPALSFRAMTHNLVVNYGLHQKMEIIRPNPATLQEMTKFHSDEYIDFLQRVTPENVSDISKNPQKFNVGEDCPVFDGMFEFSALSAGGSLAAAAKLNRGDADIAINWGGGLHHARRGEASGFCYVNDIVLSILELLRVHQRVVYIDIDVHHGDGVEEAFYGTDRVMTVSFHKYGEFFPGSGSLKDTGMGKGKKYAVNCPLRDGMDDASYKSVFRPIMSAVMQFYRPSVVVLQCGADSLAGDRLGCFNLSMRGHAQALEYMKTFNVPILMLGGGGYTIRNVARTWTYETALAVGHELPTELPFNDYFQYYGPEYKLDVPSGNMENLNNREYLEKVVSIILDNLRDLPHAPSVQTHDVPRDLFDEDPDAMNEDRPERSDVRITANDKDKRVSRDGEYSDSEDEGPVKRRDIQNHGEK
ncbi:hypothetical protein CcCBS67573_g06833 [Chytriomyces confervae]|uniref:Histone deacetylase n=1 Tax=Chytriomyces confervae TaxID=246404 RepID=A0A507F0A9_9FUNG|nr:hypothetical protein CcCBS67573_g06833 [Chytriomyces confervae]